MKSLPPTVFKTNDEMFKRWLKQKKQSSTGSATWRRKGSSSVAISLTLGTREDIASRCNTESESLGWNTNLASGKEDEHSPYEFSVRKMSTFRDDRRFEDNQREVEREAR